MRRGSAAGLRLCGAAAALLLLTGAQTPAPKSEATVPRYCLTIAVPLRMRLREEVSAIDLVIEHAHVVAIPRFPIGWKFTIENPIDAFPTKAFAGAEGSLAELGADELKCFFEIESDIPGAPPAEVTGSVSISTGTSERRVPLHDSDIRLDRINGQ